MDPVNVIRAPSLKRGKADERLSDRVSVILSIFECIFATKLIIIGEYRLFCVKMQ